MALIISVFFLALAAASYAQPRANVMILGPAAGSHLGGAGSIDNLTDMNRAQCLAVGDFNGDGIDDLAISAPDAAASAGIVYVIFGRADLPATIDTAQGREGGVDLTISGAVAGSRLGFALASGDINGDGIKDLLIGAPGASSNSLAGAGAVYVVLGSRTLSTSATLDLTQPNAAALVLYGKGDRFGAAISIGDAGGPATSRPIMDMLIGAPGVSTESAGAGYLIFGRPDFGSAVRQVDLSSSVADFTVYGSDRQRLGVATAIGDVNGDGIGDLFFGAPGSSRPARFDSQSLAPMGGTGAVFGVYGPISQGGALVLAQSQPSLSLYGFNVGDRFGAAIAIADFTGDGVADLAVGAPSASGTFRVTATNVTYTLPSNAGAAYVFAGSNALVGPRLDVAAEEYSTVSVYIGEGQLGFSLFAGSYNIPGNADNVPDLIAGIPAAGKESRFNLVGYGAAKVLFGGQTLLSTKARPRSPANPASAPEELSAFDLDMGRGAEVGFSVAAGDLNADSSGDLISSAPFATANGRSQAGVVEVFFGTVKVGGGGPGPTPVTLQFSNPLGGERFLSGTQVTISWSATGKDQISSYDLRLSTDSGATFPTLIAGGLNVTQESFVWTVPDVCSGSARLQLVANTAGGSQVVGLSNSSFSIEQRGPSVDLNRSSIGTDTLLLLAPAGAAFSAEVSVEISRDAAGSSYASFTRTPKLKAGGRKLKTRGTLDGMNLDQFFPDGAARSIRISTMPCGVTLLNVRRSGDQLVLIGGGM